MDKYLETVKNENSRAAALVVLKKIDEFLDGDFEKIREMDEALVDLFMKKECTGKSETTISNLIARIKGIFKFYENYEAVKHLTLDYIKQLTEFRGMKYFTPYDIYNMIESLQNYQDKALILFIYIDLYDNDFETIRHIKKSQFKNNELHLDNGTVVRLNEYCSNIIKNAIKEDVVEKYVNAEGRASTPYKLSKTDYIIRSKERKGGAEIVPAFTLKKRFEALSKSLNIEGVSPITIKNSKLIYDLIKLEYESNCGIDINQVELKNYCRDNNMKGSIEKLNISKKELKEKILTEIIEDKDAFIRV